MVCLAVAEAGAAPGGDEGAVANINDKWSDCSLCEAVLTDIAHSLPADYTISQLQATLDYLCTKLGQYSSDCDKAVIILSPIVYDAITGIVPANTTCENIYLCPGNATSELRHTPTNNVTCFICDHLLETTAGILAHTNITWEEARQVMYDACALLGPEKQPSCDSYVNVDGYYVYGALSGGIPPGVICEMISWCPPRVDNIGLLKNLLLAVAPASMPSD